MIQSARARYRLLVLAGLLVSLAGCGVLGGRSQPVVHHSLEVPAASTPAGVGQPLPATLLFDRPRPAGALLAGASLLYSRAPGTLAQYQYARWSEPPADTLGRELRRRIERAGLFQAVADLDSGVRGDYLLNSRLLDFRHDAGQAPGQVRVELEVELVRRADASLIGRQVFVATAPAASHDAAGAAAGLGSAGGRLLDDVAAWLALRLPARADRP